MGVILGGMGGEEGVEEEEEEDEGALLKANLEQTTSFQAFLG